MNVMILQPDEAVAMMRRLAGKTEADDLRTKIVQSENSIFKALRYHHREAGAGLTGGTWWQVVMAEALEQAEAAMVAAEAKLRELGEPRSTSSEDRARERCGFFPYTGHMADYMAAHLGASAC